MNISIWKNFKEKIVRGLIISLIGVSVLSVVACSGKNKKQDAASSGQTSEVTQAKDKSADKTQSTDAKTNKKDTESKEDTDSTKDTDSKKATDSTTKEADAGTNKSDGNTAKSNSSTDETAADHPSQETVIGKSENASDKAKQIAAGAAQNSNTNKSKER